jgi:hypothetical protein
MLFDCFSSYLYMRVLKLTLGNFCSTYFPLLFNFYCEASERTCSCVRTCLALSISYLTACRPDKYVPCPDASFLLSLPNTHTTFYLFYHVVLCVFFSRTDPEIFAFSTHLFSFPGISFDFPYSLKLWFFLEYWNL